MLFYALALLPLYLVLHQPINQFLLSAGFLSPNSTLSTSFLNFGSGSGFGRGRGGFVGVDFEPDFESSETFLLVPWVDAEIEERSCGGQEYGVHILSRTPLVLYLEGFLREEERRELLALSEPLYNTSTINSAGTPQIDPSIRASLTATPPRTPTIQCIEARALALQGWKKDLWLEKLRVQKYGEGGHYVHHFDWAGGRVGVALREKGDTKERKEGEGDGNGDKEGEEREEKERREKRELRGSMERSSSFMVYVETSGAAEGETLVGGGTEFPRLKNPLWPSSSPSSLAEKERWCKWIECPSTSTSSSSLSAEDEESATQVVEEYGVTFKPVAGNAVFWENLREDGSGYDETWHSGLPVQKGVKVGLNIWGWSVYPGR